MGKRACARGRAEKLTAPESEYTSPQGDVLVLRGALTPKTRRQYHDVLHGNVLSQEDAWQRASELLFERLAVRWVVSDVPTEASASCSCATRGHCCTSSCPARRAPTTTTPSIATSTSTPTSR